MRQTTSVSKLVRILPWMIAAILFLLPFHALLSTWVGSNTEHLDLARIWKDILVVLMLPFALVLAYNNRQLRQWLAGSWIVRLFVIYALLHFILGFWAYSHHQVNNTALVYALIINLRFVYFLILCATVAAFSDFLARNWVKILLWPASAVVFFGLLQKFILPSDFLRHFGYGPNTVPPYQTVDANIDYTRLQSTLRGANPLGAYLILIIPALLLRTRRKTYLWLGGLLMSLIVLFYSYSRSALVGLTLALSSFGWILIRRPTRRGLITGLLSLLIISGLYLGFRSDQTVQDIFLHTSNSSTSVVSSNQIRNAALKDSARDVIHEPLGRGPGTAGPASFRNDHPARIAEDYYLQIGQEVGIIGLVLFVGINILVARELWRQRQTTLAQILLASLVGISFINLVSHAWTDDTLAYIWWGLAGIACAPAIISDRHKQKDAKKVKKPA